MPSPRLDAHARENPPFATALKEASEFAVKTLRDETGSGGTPTPDEPAAPAPKPSPSLNGGATEEPGRTPAQARLGGLLKRMAELADASITDPAAEAEYHAISAEVMSAQAEVALEQRGAAQHG